MLVGDRHQPLTVPEHRESRSELLVTPRAWTFGPAQQTPSLLGAAGNSPPGAGFPTDRRPDRISWLAAVGELILLTVLFTLYKLGRMLADGSVKTAWDNAYEVLHIEDTLHMPSELGIQDWLLNAHWLVEAANMYYAWVHFPATVLFLAWTYFRRAEYYRVIRNWMVLVTAGATVGHIVFPLAPPRMLQPVGFVDTAAVYGPGVYSAPDVHSFANQYAAMPSLHVGWAVLVGVSLVWLTRSRWRWLWLAHPIITLVVVVGTANHYWMDAIVALALLTLALPIVLVADGRRRARWRTADIGQASHGPGQRNGRPTQGSGPASTQFSGNLATQPPPAGALRSSRIDPPPPTLREAPPSPRGRRP